MVDVASRQMWVRRVEDEDTNGSSEVAWPSEMMEEIRALTMAKMKERSEDGKWKMALPLIVTHCPSELCAIFNRFPDREGHQPQRHT